MEDRDSEEDSKWDYSDEKQENDKPDDADNVRNQCMLVFSSK